MIMVAVIVFEVTAVELTESPGVYVTDTVTCRIPESVIPVQPPPMPQSVIRTVREYPLKFVIWVAF
jgi:hypothetical protein